MILFQMVKNMAFGSESNCRTFDDKPKLQNNAKDWHYHFRMEDVEMLPVLLIGDYTDFILVKNMQQREKCSVTQKMHYCLTGFTFP
jgi:hypothetical protein